jgi:hypothetical protein
MHYQSKCDHLAFWMDGRKEFVSGRCAWDGRGRFKGRQGLRSRRVAMDCDRIALQGDEDRMAHPVTRNISFSRAVYE